MRSTRSAIALFSVVIVILSQPISSFSIDVSTDLQHGPYIDKVVFQIESDYDERIQRLQSGVVEMDSNPLRYSDISQLSPDPDIEIFSSPRNGYGQITFNCARYPFNISGFRQAFAFAFNKSKITYDIYNGHTSIHDSLVSSANPWCAEDR